MILFLADIVAIAAVGFLVLRRGRDQRAGRIRSARWLRVAGLFPLGLPVAIWLFFGIGEMASGEPGGAAHLLGAAGTTLLGILAWMRPIEGGVAPTISQWYQDCQGNHAGLPLRASRRGRYARD